jgi:outer membrane immunogenic protein
MKRLVGAVLAGLACLTSSHAETADFSGPYIALSASFDSATISDRLTLDQGIATSSFKSNGPYLELAGGYNYEVYNNVIIGAEASFGYGLGNNGNTTFDDEGNTLATSIKQKWSVGAAARLGYVFEQDFMVYGLVGYERKTYSGKLTSAGTFATTNIANGSISPSGFKFGGGVQLNLSDHLSARLEYVRVNLGTQNFYSCSATTCNGVFRDDWKLKNDRFTYGMAYKF